MQIRTTVAAFLTIGTIATAQAQDFPARSVTMVMPYAAGGPGDTITRILAQGMTEPLKQSVVVENTAGAGGTIGSARVANAAPDGYTLLVMHIGQATNVTLYPNIKYDAIKDFEPIGLVAEAPMAIVAKKATAAANFTEFVAYLKANKDKVTYAHAGIGSASHLCGLLFFSHIGMDLRSVPYRGTGPAMNDLIGGQVDFLCDQTVNTVPNVLGGTIKGYAVTTPARLPSLPNIPTAVEMGMKGFELTIWYALYAPKATPKPVIDKLVASLQTALADPNVKGKLAGLGVDAMPTSRAQPAALAAHLKSEIARWAPVIKKSGAVGQ